MGVVSQFEFRTDDRVADLLNTYPDAHRILRELGLDLRAEAGLTLAEAAAAAECDPAAFFADLARRLRLEPDREDEGTQDWSSMDFADLAHHVIDVHHAFLRAELGRLQVLLAGREEVVAQVVTDFRVEVDRHLADEESWLLPLIRLSSNRMTSQGDVQRFSHNHEALDAGLAYLRGTVAERPLPDPELQELVRAGVEGIVEDFARHSWKEDEFLIPGIVHLQELRGRRPV